MIKMFGFSGTSSPLTNASSNFHELPPENRDSVRLAAEQATIANSAALDFTP
jgi:hypothetical protein